MLCGSVFLLTQCSGCLLYVGWVGVGADYWPYVCTYVENTSDPARVANTSTKSVFVKDWPTLADCPIPVSRVSDMMGGYCY